MTSKTMLALQAAYRALQAVADAAADDAFPFEKGAPKVLTPDEAQAVAKHVEAAKTLLHTIGGLVSYAGGKGVQGG